MNLIDRRRSRRNTAGAGLPLVRYMCNAPATFEQLMDRVLQGLRWSRCLVYLDDIISFGYTFDSALANLTLIFERLRSYGLQLKSTKCHLFRSSGIHCGSTRFGVQPGLGAYTSFWDFGVTTDASFRILPTLRCL